MTEEEKNKKIKDITNHIKSLEKEIKNIEQEYANERAKYTDQYNVQLNIGDTVIFAANNEVHKGIITELYSGGYKDWGNCVIQYDCISRNLEKNIPKCGSKNKKITRWTWQTIKI